MVGYPYTKYTVSVMDVDMAAAVVVASHEAADALGVPADRRVYLRGWAYGRRPRLRGRARRPRGAHRRWPTAFDDGARRAPASASTTSPTSTSTRCFASSVHFALDALGVDQGDPRGVTVTGGLPFAGGAGSDYLTHSIATMVDVLPGRPGLVRPGRPASACT